MLETFVEALGNRRKSLFSFGTIFVILGAAFLYFQTEFPKLIFGLLGILFLLKAIKTAVDRINEVRSITWSEVFLDTIIGLILLSNILVSFEFLALVISFLLAVMGVIAFIDLWASYKVRGQLSFWGLSEGFFNLMLAGVALFEIGHVTDLFYLVLSIHWIVFGTLRIVDGFFITSETSRLRYRSGMPILFSVFLPIMMLNKVNHHLKRDISDVVELTEGKKDASSADLEVWIHTARKGIVMVGHVDISYNGMTYSYGPYDPDGVVLFGLFGDGVLFTLSSDDYLDSLAGEEERAVFGYGIRLTNEQKDVVEANLKQMLAKTREFSLITETQKDSYLGQLSQRYDVQTNKFQSSKFETYSLLTTNCVLLADTILNNMVTDIIGSYGILTPGSYLDYLNKAYENPHSNVVSRFVFGQQGERSEEVTE